MTFPPTSYYQLPTQNSEEPFVDWTQASVGRPEVDVGHMRWNLTADYDADVADRFLSLDETALQSHLDAQPHWDLVTLLDLVLDVEDPLPTEELKRLEMHASAALGALTLKGSPWSGRSCD